MPRTLTNIIRLANELGYEVIPADRCRECWYLVESSRAVGLSQADLLGGAGQLCTSHPQLAGAVGHAVEKFVADLMCRIREHTRSIDTYFDRTQLIRLSHMFGLIDDESQTAISWELTFELANKLLERAKLLLDFAGEPVTQLDHFLSE